MCANNGQACGGANPACCQGLTCNGQGVCASPDNRKPIGSACTMNAECLTGLCLSVPGYSGMYCSTACNMSTTCQQLSPDFWCIAGQGANFCQPNCNTSADCQAIGPDWSCDNIPDIEGLLHGVCGVFKNLPEGYECKDNAQCANGTCNGAFCSAACINDAACGQYAKCLLTQDQSYRCFPNCNNNNNCAVYGLGLTCKAATSRDNATVMICSN